MSPTSRTYPALVLLPLLTLVAACDSETAEPELAAADQTYTLRGELKGVEADELAIHHEAIDDFVNEEGETVGMDSMTMPFAVASGLSVARFSEGDLVEFTFEVRWKSGPRLLVTSLVQLPSTTELVFEKAETGESAEEGGHEGHEGHDHGAEPEVAADEPEVAAGEPEAETAPEPTPAPAGRQRTTKAVRAAPAAAPEPEAPAATGHDHQDHQH